MNERDALLAQAFRPLELRPESHPEFFNAWEEIAVERHQFLTEAGSIERYFYVVINGIQAIYILSRSGDKKVIGFSYDGSFSGIYDSFLHEKPSHYFLEALSPSRLLRMNKSSYDLLFQHYEEFNYWGRIAHQEFFIGRVSREIELITLTARERYESFMERCPEPLRNIPQKYLASYLNMTPETFSRMRAEKS